MLGLGVVYWALWTQVLPRWGGYIVVPEREMDEYGVEVVRYRRVADAQKVGVLLG